MAPKAMFQDAMKEAGIIEFKTADTKAVLLDIAAKHSNVDDLYENIKDIKELKAYAKELKEAMEKANEPTPMEMFDALSAQHPPAPEQSDEEPDKAAEKPKKSKKPFEETPQGILFATLSELFGDDGPKNKIPGKNWVKSRTVGEMIQYGLINKNDIGDDWFKLTTKRQRTSYKKWASEQLEMHKKAIDQLNAGLEKLET
ncbi:hypothetical protein TetV_346 [Tetraselmis virus 1]|uniref:Uncharacterized protein n=1 Tax=Tetraselmis virus 1 TaxID=2060617 RepID=A0A2P0VNF6_9VIRU|nr:hypothetical protein QJ968_gp346 [Tetraselmis virus 1]AUF82438.1 hypothetical protein TetV_346 [Tetraselmis virus 1]